MTTAAPTTEKDRSIWRRLLASPAGQAAVSDEEAAHASRRQELIAEKMRLTSDAEARAPKLRKAEAAALKARNFAREKLRMTEIELSRSIHVAYGVSHQHSTQIARIDCELIETADPRIDEAIERWSAELEQVRRTKIYGWEEQTGRQLNGYSETIRRSNSPDVVRGLERIAAAIHGLGELKLMNSENVEANIFSITNGLPTARDFAA